MFRYGQGVGDEAFTTILRHTFEHTGAVVELKLRASEKGQLDRRLGDEEREPPAQIDGNNITVGLRTNLIEERVRLLRRLLVGLHLILLQLLFRRLLKAQPDAQQVVRIYNAGLGVILRRAIIMDEAWSLQHNRQPGRLFDVLVEVF